MDTKDIECFEAVYSERSMHRAAKRLYISPQGLGRIIQKLEQELDTVLFERSRQGVIPTESGMLLHEHGKQISEGLQRLQDEIRGLHTGTKLLRVGLANGVLRAVPLQRILDFGKLNPDIRVEWAEYPNRELRRMIKDGELEYGLMVGESRESGLSQWKLHSISQVLLVYEGHPLYQAAQVNLDQLRNEPLITMNEQFRMYHDFVRACKIKGFVPNIVARTTDGGTLVQLCAQGVGLGILPEFEGGYPAKVHGIPFEEPTTWDVYTVCSRERKSSELITRFDRYLKSGVI